MDSMNLMIKVKMIGIFTHSLAEITNQIWPMKHKGFSRRMAE
jgi:hypothetical protein